MNQEISIDLMYTILYSIINHTVGIPKSKMELKTMQDSPGDQFYYSDFKQVYQDYDFKNKNNTNLDYIM